MKLILTAMVFALLSAASIKDQKPAKAVVLRPVVKDVIICGNNWPPCMSDKSGNLHWFNAVTTGLRPRKVPPSRQDLPPSF